jgi:cold shock CspA family protein
MTSMTGTVKRLVRDKRFGFIAAGDGGQEYFFHSSACTESRFDDLQEGERGASTLARDRKDHGERQARTMR